MGAITAVKAGLSVVSYLRTMMDPEKRQLLEDQITEHVLEELPRIARLLEERCADLEARGCTHYEANMIAQQTIESHPTDSGEQPPIWFPKS